MLPFLSVAHAADRAPGAQDSPLAMAVLVLFGAFPVVASWRNWDWFFNHRKARLFVAMFGRNGARVFYTILGLLIGVGAGGRMVYLLLP